MNKKVSFIFLTFVMMGTTTCIESSAQDQALCARARLDTALTYAAIPALTLACLALVAEIVVQKIIPAVALYRAKKTIEASIKNVKAGAKSRIKKIKDALTASKKEVVEQHEDQAFVESSINPDETNPFHN